MFYTVVRFYKNYSHFHSIVRFVVRIDSWDIGSLYPNGHFVRSLGKAGNIETEISAILVEHRLSVAPFSDGILKEMPVNSKENPWIMEESELKRRKDLRLASLSFHMNCVWKTKYINQKPVLK